MKPTPVFSIRDLEDASGMPRTTIHAYLRLGLLPRPQKTAPNRSLYTEEHIKLLSEIVELKSRGLSLDEIKAALEHKATKANNSAVDLAAQEYERMHNRILAMAAREISTKGYRNMHVLTLTTQLGITSRVFYSHFSSKRRLLIECFLTMAQWTVDYVASKQATTTDPGERLLWSLFGNSLLQDLGPSAMLEIQLEETNSGGELREPIQAAWAAITQQIQNALPEGPWSVPLKLLGYSLLGAYERTLMRAAQDDKYNREDLLRTHLWVFLAIKATQTGQWNIESELSRYEGLITYLASHRPPMPPALET